MIDGMMTNLNNQAAEQYIANPGGSMAAFDAIGQQLGGGMGAAPAASPPAPSLALARSTELVLFRAANVTAVFKKLRKVRARAWVRVVLCVRVRVLCCTWVRTRVCSGGRVDGQVPGWVSPIFSASACAVPGGGKR